MSTIARYLETMLCTVYRNARALSRGAVRGSGGPITRAQAAGNEITLATTNAVRQLQQNPELGEWRVRAVLLQLGSPRTCGRILAKNRALYGLCKPTRSLRSKKAMPFKAAQRHQYWSIDIRYISRD